MAISFQKTNAQVQFTMPEKGPYYAKITAAEIKTPADPSKYPYLNITYEIYNAKKEKKGMIFDMLSTSDAQFPQYRMARFITALGLDGKEFNSYGDICKVIKERKLGFFITPDTSDYVKANPDKARMIVDSKDEGVYYTTTEIATYMPEIAPAKTNTPKAAPAPVAPRATTVPAAPVADDSAPFATDDDF